MFEGKLFEPTKEQFDYISDALKKAANEMGLRIINANDILGKGYLYAYGIGKVEE